MSSKGKDSSETEFRSNGPGRMVGALALILENISDGISLFDADLKLLAINARALELMDFSPDQIQIGDSLEVMFRINAERGEYGPGDREDQIRERMKIARRFEPHDFERTRPDGTIIRIRGNPVPTGGFVTTYMDVTEQRKAEIAQRNSEALFRDFAEMSSDWIWETDAEGRYCEVSEGYFKVTGLRREDIIGKNRQEFRKNNHLRSETMDGIEARDYHREAYDRREPFNYDLVNVFSRSDGSNIFYQVNGRPIFDDNGEFQGYRGTARNITERKQAEKALRDSEALLIDAVESLPVGFNLYDAEDRLVLSNSMMMDMIPGVFGEHAVGLTYEEIMRNIIREGRTLESVGREDEFVAEQLENHRNPSPGGREIKTTNDRTLHYIERRTSVGGTVVIRSDITKRKRAEAAMRESEARFRDFAETASDWQWETDAEGRYTDITDGFFKVFGFRREEMIGKRRREVQERTFNFFSEDGNDLRDAHLDAFDRCEPFTDLVSEHSRPDGSRLYIQSGGKPVFDDNGEFQGYRGTARNITERKLAEKALRDSEALLIDAVESLPIGFAVWDAEDRLVLANGVVMEMLPEVYDEHAVGLTFEELSRKGARDGLVLEAVGNEDQWLRDHLERHRNPNPEDRELTLNNGRTWLIADRRTSNGGSVGIRMDITKSKRAEAALRESEALLVDAVESLPIGFALYDSEDRLVLANSMVMEMLPEVYDEHAVGLTYEELSRKSALGGLPSEAVGNEDQWLRDHLEQHRNPNPEGREIPMKNGRTWFLADRKTSNGGWVGIRMDITERKRAEEALVTLNQELEERVEARTEELRATQGKLMEQERLATLGRLSATVSHELRNPLGTVRTSMHILRKMTEQDSGKFKQVLDRVDRNVTRCDGIIDDMLGYARARDIKPQTLVLDKWLGELLDEHEIPQKISLEREFAISNIEVPVDPEWLRRAIVNVLQNACQAMTEIEETDKRLRVGLAQVGNQIEISIADTGPGIPDENREKIFEPLFSTKSFGTGLGLAVVKQVLEGHGGMVTFDEYSGAGTCFRLRLPLSQPAESAAE